MVMQMFGKFLPNFLTIYHSQLLSKTKYFVYMEVSHQVLTHWIKSDNLIECKKCLMRVRFVICYGLILMIVVGGVFLPEVLATVLAKISLNNLIMQTA